MIFKAGDNFEIDYEVTERIYQGFIDIFNDRNPLHTDDQFAKDKQFTSKVMHGAILTGFLSNFIGEMLPIKNIVVLSYSISFQKPVYLRDKLKLHAIITEVFPSVNCVNIGYHFENADKISISKGKISIRII